MRADAEFLPLTGAPGRLDDLAAAGARGATALSATADDLMRLDRALDGQRSTAVDAARDVVADLHADVTLGDEVLRNVAAVLADRATALTREQHQAATAISRRDSALARLAQAEAAEAAAWQRDPAAWPGETARRVWDARARAAEARADVTDAEAQWRSAREAKDAGSRAAAARIGALEHVRAVRLAVGQGIGVGAFIHSWQRGQALAASFRDVTVPREPGPPDSTLRAGVRGLGDDPVAWRAFWEHTETDAVLAEFSGAGPDDEAMDALRTGVEVVAASSTEAEQEAFGRRLVEGLGDQPHTGEGEAALLAGMLGGALPTAVHAGAADALTDRRSRPELVMVGGTTVTAPVAEVVARGLAQDPERALEHFAGDGPHQADERARFWFGDTPVHGWSDGGVAISALLSVAVLAGNAPDATMTQRNQAATAITAATPHLAAPTGLLSAKRLLPPQVEVNIVRAYEPYIPSFGDAVNPDGERTGLAREPGYVEPDLDPRSLCVVIDSTSRTAYGTVAWVGASDAYLDDVETVLDVAPDEAGPRLKLIPDAAENVMVIAGAMEADVLQHAAARQELVRTTSTVASAGVGIATLGTSTPVSAAGLAVSSAVPFVAGPLGANQIDDTSIELDAAGTALSLQYTERLTKAAEDADDAAGYDDDFGRLPNAHEHDRELTSAYLKAADLNDVIERH